MKRINKGFRSLNKWKKILLFMLLIISLGLNVWHAIDKKDQINKSFTKYQSELVRATNAFSESFKIDADQKYHYRVASNEALASAEAVFSRLGDIDPNFAYDASGKVYYVIPYEMRWLLTMYWSKPTDEQVAGKINEILQIYAKHLQAVRVQDPNSVRNIYIDIRHEIEKEGLLQGDIDLPPSLY